MRLRYFIPIVVLLGLPLPAFAQFTPIGVNITHVAGTAVTADPAHGVAFGSANSVPVGCFAVASTGLPMAVDANDKANIVCNLKGVVYVQPIDPCADPSQITSAPIEESTAAINEVVALNGSDLIFVCSYKWVTTLANSLQWVRGTGSDCGTGTTDIEGPQPYAATGGVTEHGGGHTLFIVPAGNALCLQSSTATAHGGRVSYVRRVAP